VEVMTTINTVKETKQGKNHNNIITMITLMTAIVNTTPEVTAMAMLVEDAVEGEACCGLLEY
jgi:hypothetical protein